MARILIPSDNRDYVRHWAETYAALGHDVVTGVFNFDLAVGNFDIMHHQWPEELCNWQMPSDAEVHRILGRMDYWKERTKVIASVNNLMPHGYERSERMAKFLDAFYNRCHVITHFSKTSESLFNQKFKIDLRVRQIVTSPINYERLLELQKSRGGDRRTLLLGDSSFVILVFGTIRNWNEVKLIQQAFARARIKGKQLLVAGNFYGGRGGIIMKALMRRMWAIWLWRHRGRTAVGYVPDEEVYRYMDSADVVVVPRLVDMNSAIPALAMTFGKVVIAPNHGAFPEFMSGTENLLYESGNPSSLARALERSVSLDRQQIGSHNAEVAASWRWDKVVQACLKSVSCGQRPQKGPQTL